VDKGRLFFEQVGLSQYSIDINRMLEPQIAQGLGALAKELKNNHLEVKQTQTSALEKMRAHLRDDLRVAIEDLS
jgi:hypothetical protein